MSLAMRPARVQRDQENAGIARRKGLKTPGRAAGTSKDALEGVEKLSKTAKEPSRILGSKKQLTLTDLGPSRLLSAKGKGLLQDKTNKTPHPSTRKAEAGPSKAVSPPKEALERAQLVASPLKTPGREKAESLQLLSPVPQKAKYSSIKTPSPDVAARLRGERAPFTPPDFAFSEKQVHSSDVWRAKVWETLEEQEVEIMAGPSATPFQHEEIESELDDQFLKELPDLLSKMPFFPPRGEMPEPPFEEMEYEPAMVYLSDEYMTDDESDEEPQTPPLVVAPSRADTKGKAASPVTQRLTKPANALPSLRTAHSTTKAARSASVSQMPPPRVPVAAIKRPATAAATRPSHSRNASSVSSTHSASAKRVPSYMLPTSASLAKLPSGSPTKTHARLAPGTVNEPVVQAGKGSELKERKRRIVFGPPTQKKAAAMALHEAEQEIKRQEVSALAAKVFDAYDDGLDDLTLFEIDDS